VNFSSSAPVRQPEIEPPEKDLPGTSAPPEAPEASADTVAHLRVLWGHRGLLFRAALYGVVASVLVALLIPSRYFWSRDGGGCHYVSQRRGAWRAWKYGQ
jgi:hypothetical protein